MDLPVIVAAMAQAAAQGGAAAVRIEGIANVAAVRSAVSCPIIGIVKVDLENSPVRITPLSENIKDLISAGADIVAVDATARERPISLGEAIDLTKGLGALFMADCSCFEDGVTANLLGADLLGTTMSGYTGGDVPELPDLELVSRLAGLGSFVVAEGRYHTPDLAANAIEAGADAVVVGSAITRLEVVTGWFRDAVKSADVK